MPLPDSTTNKQSTPLRQVVVAPHGATYRDGGVLDFGRDRAFLIEENNCEILLPQSLVKFIEDRAPKGYIGGSEQHGSGAAGGNADAGDGQARQG